MRRSWHGATAAATSRRGGFRTRSMKPCAISCGRGGRKSGTAKPWRWVKALRFEHAAQEATYLDYLHEVEHAAERVARLERAIDQAIEALPPQMRAVSAGLQALRGR